MSAPGLGRRFLVVWAGQTVSAIGSVVSGVGVGVYVFVETGDAAWLGLLAALAAIPFVATAPLLKLTDRFPRRTTMIAADTFAVIAPAAALSLAFAGRLEVWHLAVAGFLGGVGSSFQFPAAQAAIPALVDADALDRANGLMQLGQAVGIVLGPVLATPLVAWWGIEAVLIADLATFVVAVVATTAIRFDDPPSDDAVPDDGSWAALWTWLRADGRPLMVLLATMAAVNFLLAFFNVTIVVMATELGGVARVGLVMGFAGGAMVVGSLLAGRRGISDDRVGTFAIGIALAGLGFVVAASHPTLTVLIAGTVVALGFVPFVGAAVSTVYHERVPNSMHGRMFGLRTSIGRALDPVGSVAAGFLVARAAEPAMDDGGSLSGSVGRVIGTGPGRGAASVLIGVGVVLVVVAIVLARSTARHTLRRDPTRVPTDVAPNEPTDGLGPDTGGVGPEAALDAAGPNPRSP